jgi:D-3-phosphoglycerate dehydrogenase
MSGSIQEILVRYSGRLTDWKTELIRNSAIQGILNQRAAEHANVVNAAAIAQERGIHVHEIRKDKVQSPGDILAVAIKTTAGELEVRGAVVRESSLRLLGIGSIYIEVPLEGNLIYIRNRDVPGVVGKVGTILGHNNVNIANFALGRAENKAGAEAISVVQVDTPAPDPVLKELNALPDVEQVCGVKL